MIGASGTKPKRGMSMDTKEMLKQMKIIMAIVNPAELSMSEAMAYASALATIAQTEAAQRQADSLEKIASKLEGMLDAYIQVHF